MDADVVSIDGAADHPDKPAEECLHVVWRLHQEIIHEQKVVSQAESSVPSFMLPRRGSHAGSAFAWGSDTK